ncbi:MAG: phosphoribosylformylglycinamidine synthase II [Tistrella sp.]|uniref:phosphoribosylformylglycinamidine synthase subunit PurL n=1 Tax=Tistrella sp. TaxID=2024861 RepID=UPI000C4A7CCB|nr:phosphoribosylformylglycinamidine synthase subunit PurL [Tistrella sp.]MAD35370.1 phosphoribosylformylglycinamidine synthase II [Tistrella sp.]MBA75142.1 phosphoribosylformylglycinamidine synthase II [Tistrella sp.]
MTAETKITPEIVAEHGLTRDEYKRIRQIMGREPNLVELGIFSAMWSEHCSYKSSKKWLKTLPTTAPWVICGPGENAGVVDIGDGQAIIFKMESHNHPSYIEPYQGAATGVGGILRDVFTMGARPIAMMNALRFGDPSHPKMKHLISGVVSGIGGYGNCVGVPTVGGETDFHPAYNGNILVNAMCVGLADADKIFYSAAAGIGNPVVYVGSKTGRDGIHGASMASAEFGEDAEQKRPTVQVGDPFTEKLLIEACLELMKSDAIVAIQDMGAAGLTSSSFEMADKGDAGIELWLDKVPTREAGMTPYELMLSESQERMLMVLKPGREDEARRVFEKWELDFAVIGKVTDTGRMVLKFHDAVAGDLPIKPLANGSPEYDRPWTPTPQRRPIVLPRGRDDLDTVLPTLEKLMGSPDLASRRWIWEQYDHMVMGDTVGRPGGDAAVVRIHGTRKAVAITTDVTPRYCYADPYQGGRQAIAETWRNLTATGAKPLAITDCLNFGNPEKPEIMGQLVGCIQGMAEACRALNFPVVSGNVSLYNETQGTGILPTPAVGGVGLIADVSRRADIAFKGQDHAIIVIGETRGHLGQSLYLREVLGREDGETPPVDLSVERRNGDFVRTLISEGLISTVHDVSDGGLMVALAEMALASGIGAKIDPPAFQAPLAWAFGEDQGRYVIAAPAAAADAVIAQAWVTGVPAAQIGVTGGTELTLTGAGTISLETLRSAHEGWLPGLMSTPA